jgi:hypothetical protein
VEGSTDLRPGRLGRGVHTRDQSKRDWQAACLVLIKDGASKVVWSRALRATDSGRRAASELKLDLSRRAWIRTTPPRFAEDAPTPTHTLPRREKAPIPLVDFFSPTRTYWHADLAQRLSLPLSWLAVHHPRPWRGRRVLLEPQAVSGALQARGGRRDDNRPCFCLDTARPALRCAEQAQETMCAAIRHVHGRASLEFAPMFGHVWSTAAAERRHVRTRPLRRESPPPPPPSAALPVVCAGGRQRPAGRGTARID